MEKIHRKALVNHSAKKLFALVNDIAYVVLYFTVSRGSYL